MKVLIVSHNPMIPTNNMGKTIRVYFDDFQVSELAQFYIRPEVPSDGSVCQNYFRFTDKDAVMSIFSFRERGAVYGQKDIQPVKHSVGTGALEPVYQFGRRRTAGSYFLRNLLWKLSRWETWKLWKWVDDFNPDVIFFASGDYGFMYDIARKIAEHTGKPLAVACVDDYYIHNRNGGHLFGRMVHKAFLRTVNKTMARASMIFTICESMAREYEAMFGKPCHVLHTSAQKQEMPQNVQSHDISYLGNLGLNRNEQLVQMGRALQKLDIPGIPKYIDVYSGERNPEILKILTPENGIRFHGAVSAEKVLEIMQGSMAIIHTESFDPAIQQMTRVSVSTKIADSLMNGPCLIAHGPEGIASMDYLKKNGAAYVITDPDALPVGLAEILTDAALREQIMANARVLADKNHSMQVNSQKVRQWLREICE